MGGGRYLGGAEVGGGLKSFSDSGPPWSFDTVFYSCSTVGTLPQAMHSCSFSRSNEILYPLTSGRMSEAAN